MCVACGSDLFFGIHVKFICQGQYQGHNFRKTTVSGHSYFTNSLCFSFKSFTVKQTVLFTLSVSFLYVHRVNQKRLFHSSRRSPGYRIQTCRRYGHLVSLLKYLTLCIYAEPHTSVGSVADLRTGGG